ncbi:50S ribosomal protein L23 [Candidatus Kuenenbacteria bacterium]|nr:50S ribosomal protein L23 [Candidatus Kuenenbacteria bacterium]
MKVEKRDDPQAYKVLIRPLVTEKATDLADLNKYCFVVPISTNKSEVAKKIINVYGVKPVKINFIRQKGKRVRHGRTFGKTKDYKKAIITLALEDKIDLYEGV